MARVAGVDLPREKRGEVAITYIYGIGRATANRILAKASVDPGKRVKAWNDDETARVREIIERELKVEGDLRRDISMNVKRLMDIGGVSRHPAPPGIAGPRPAHPHQRADAQGAAQGRDGEEEAHSGGTRPGGRSAEESIGA